MGPKTIIISDVAQITNKDNYLLLQESPRRRATINYLTYIDTFRAIAILMIVGVHCLDFLKWSDSKQSTRNFFDDLFADGSLVFVFIAGFLFQHLSYKFKYAEYLKKKILNVITPYLILSVPAIYFSGFYKKAILADQPKTLLCVIQKTAWYYIVGGAHVNYPYWFIPMIVLFYMAAPIFIKMIRHPRLYYYLGVLIPISIFVHRPPWPHLNPFHNFLYFCSAYVWGMFCSQYKERVFKFIDQRLPLFIGMYVVCFCMYYLSGEHGIHTAESIFSQEHGYIDLPYIEKILFSFILFVLLKKYNYYLPQFLKKIADFSFSIYFIHIYVLMCIEYIIRGSFLAYGNWFTWCILFVLTVAGSLVITWLGKSVLGRRSRFIMGS